MMYKCIIVDNDVACIDLLETLLAQYCKQIVVCAKVKTIQEAVLKINEFNPEVVFLDIKLNAEMGFDLFKFFSAPHFQVIFTTSYEKYALRAMKLACLDYILKPVDAAELVNAVSKLDKIFNVSDNQKRISALINNSEDKDNKITKLAIPSLNSIILINIDDIICLEADAKYTKLYLNNNESILSSKNIGEYESMFDENFFRCHKSWIVNLKFAKKFLKSDGQIELSNGMLIDLSTRKKEEFFSLFAKG
jgi:two-component system, LytTR family, response regulator